MEEVETVDAPLSYPVLLVRNRSTVIPVGSEACHLSSMPAPSAGDVIRSVLK